MTTSADIFLHYDTSMERQHIGCGLHDFHLPTRLALKRAYDMGFGAVEIGTTSGDTTPDQLSQSGRRELARLVQGRGMNTAALDAHAGGGWTDPGHNEERIDHAKSVIHMACEMGVPVVTAGVGRIGDESSRGMVESALSEIGDLCDRTGTLFAVRTEGVEAEMLADIITGLGCPSLKYCIDPASLLMSDDDPGEVIARLDDGILLAHARDVVQGSSGVARETVLGEGQVDYLGFLAALSAAGYHGPHIVRRTDSPRPTEDIARAKVFLDGLPSL